MTDTTGLQFVVTTPFHAVDKPDRRFINAHATRARRRQRRRPEIRSWISPDRELESLKAVNAGQATSIPKRAGTDFSGLQLPSGIEPCMIQELIKRKHVCGSDLLRLIVKYLTDKFKCLTSERPYIPMKSVCMFLRWSEAGFRT